MSFARHRLSFARHSVLTLSIVATLAVSTPAGAQCNTNPVAVADVASAFEGRRALIDVLANDFDADGQPLSVSLTSESCPGAVAVEDEGLLSYTPPALSQSEVSCTIGYRLADSDGGAAFSSVDVVVTGKTIFRDGFESGSTSAWSAEGFI